MEGKFSRSKNTFRNMFTGLSTQIINNIFQFICRTVFIETLGKEYLGLSGLFINILQILNLAELGFASTIMYTLYGAIYSKDEKKINSLMTFFKKVYLLVGIVILIIGLGLMPFLNFIVKDVSNNINIHFYFFIYLVQAIVSYFFFAYKSVLLEADQKRYVADIYTFFTNVLMNILQIISLIVFKSFSIYICISIFTTILKNILISISVDKKYPYIKNKSERLSSIEEKGILKKVYAMGLYKISDVIVNSTDTIIISSFISVSLVGIYSNYMMIFGVIRLVIANVFNSFTASVGNLLVSGYREYNEFIFRCINFINFWITGICSVCFLILFQDFIYLWIGNTYLLNYSTVFILVINFMTIYLYNAVKTYKDATGLFEKGKYRPVFTSLLNLILSIYLANEYGISGIFLGTIVARMSTTWWFDAWLIYKYTFSMSPKNYFLRYIRSVIIILVSYYITKIITDLFHGISWTNLILKLIIVLLTTNSIYFLLFYRSEEFKYLLQKVRKTNE
ncbi:lipopolysaccharide biosynthesis protein [Enterococcus devriesei]|uniref:lipopolysaccharide biosynthesis protein n=1 Tax=Enterococcus devriesei TaxID=319970 RepID=UPI0028AD657B|nr:hypothetical protein [Enterococcus devriesei]